MRLSRGEKLPDPTQLPEGTVPNSSAAIQLLRDYQNKRAETALLRQRPTRPRGEFRLPLFVKYHKPVGVITKLRAEPRFRAEDLRHVMAFEGKDWELDLYHPVGHLLRAASGLFLWSRSGRLTDCLNDESRGVLHQWVAEVKGAVDAAKMSKRLRKGFRFGELGFEEGRLAAELIEAYIVPDAPLQDPRSIVTLAAREGRDMVSLMLDKCGYEVVRLKRTMMGPIGLVGADGKEIAEGKLGAPTDAEEAWACALARLPKKEYPPGTYLPLPAAEEPPAGAEAEHGGSGYDDEALDADAEEQAEPAAVQHDS